MQPSPPSLPPGGLYLLTPDGLSPEALVQLAEQAITGGAAVVQYRDKGRADSEALACARALVRCCHARGVPLVVNDSIDLALAAGAAGVHLGGDDGELAAARSRLGPGPILGASCYDDLERARAAQAAGASYLAFGSFFPSSSKTSPYRPTPALLGAAAAFGLPRVAIGGIRPDNGGRLIAAGAEFLAVLSGVATAADPVAAARHYRSLFELRGPPSQ